MFLILASSKDKDESKFPKRGHFSENNQTESTKHKQQANRRNTSTNDTQLKSLIKSVTMGTNEWREKLKKGKNTN